LFRMARFLEPHAVCEQVDGRVSLTAKGRLLRSDSPVWSSLVLNGANDAAWHLDHSLRTGEAAFPRAFGADFWSFLAAHPDQQEAFADAMRLQSAMLAVACVPLLAMSRVAKIGDIVERRGGRLSGDVCAQSRGVLV